MSMSDSSIQNLVWELLKQVAKKEIAAGAPTTYSLEAVWREFKSMEGYRTLKEFIPDRLFAEAYFATGENYILQEDAEEDLRASRRR